MKCCFLELKNIYMMLCRRVASCMKFVQSPFNIQAASVWTNLNKKRKIPLSRLKFDMISSASKPKGGPKPPDFETVAYKHQPQYLSQESWQRRGDMDSKSIKLWHTKWAQQKDARKRAVATFYGDIRTRLQALRFNGFLPNELKQVADVELYTLPVDSDESRIRNGCVFTGRKRGKKTRWRASRFVHRQMADHGMAAGTMRAVWGVNNDKNRLTRISNKRNY